jgi:hypothetical protein
LSKLLNLQEWTTCDDAARYLTQRMKEQVSKADVLRLALFGRLKLSVFLPRPTWALLGTLIDVCDVSEHFPPDGYTWVEEGDDWYDHDHNIRARRHNLYNEWVSSKDTVIVDGGRNQVLEVKSGVEIEGIWDLTMRGGERNYVYGLSIGKTVHSIHPKGVQHLGEVPVVKDPHEQGDLAYALLPALPFVRFFPKDCRLVVRTAALQELGERISPEPGHGTEITNSSKNQDRQITSPRGVYSQAKLYQWYRQRVASWPNSTLPPSRDDDLRDAKAEGFPSVPREAIRKLRKNLAPAEWSKKGARPRQK